METMHASHGFGPVVDKESKILILGSFPSVKSRERGFFYMYPQNRFWVVLSKLLNEDFVSIDIPEKRELLLKHHIALYDVIESCDIKGSSDASISNVVPSDIDKIIKKSGIKHIYLNGQKAYSLFSKYDKQLMNIAVRLPSTSPANASWSLNRLVNKWQIIFCNSK